MINQANIMAAVDAWLTDSTGGSTTYGDMMWWDVQYVTSMQYLFSGMGGYGPSTATAQKAAWAGIDLSHWCARVCCHTCVYRC